MVTSFSIFNDVASYTHLDSLKTNLNYEMIHLHFNKPIARIGLSTDPIGWYLALTDPSRSIRSRFND
jgi:hypothetical protein